MRENIEEADIASGKQAMSIEDPTTSYSMTMFKLYFSDISPQGSLILSVYNAHLIYITCVSKTERIRGSCDVTLPFKAHDQLMIGNQNKLSFILYRYMHTNSIIIIYIFDTHSMNFTGKLIEPT